jgi:WD40 repeat protein
MKFTTTIGAFLFVVQVALVQTQTRRSAETPTATPPVEGLSQVTEAPISPANASKVRRVAEFPKRVFKILPGPKPGELAFFELFNLVEIVDEVDYRPLRQLAEQSSPADFALSRDGRFAAWHVRRTKTYVVQELCSGKTVEVDLEKTPGLAGSRTPGLAGFSGDATLLAVGETFWSLDAEGEGTSVMRLFDLSGKLLRTLESPGPGAMTPVFSPGGKTLAVGNRNYETRLFEVATGKLLHTLPRKMTHVIAFSPDGKVLAVAYVDGAVVLWDVATGEARHSFKNAAKEVSTLDWNPKGDVLVSAGVGGKIALRDANKLEALAELDSPGWVSSVRFTNNGARLVSSGGVGIGQAAERKVVIWAVQDGEE